MQTLYVVVGETGEYADSRNWNVVGYTDKNLAEQHAKLANDLMQEGRPQHLSHADRSEFLKSFPYDNEPSVDTLTGTTYSVAEIPLVAHVDEYIETFTKS
jgi:hypothetical protein